MHGHDAGVVGHGEPPGSDPTCGGAPGQGLAHYKGRYHA
ncbi:protein of unknown function (plasmid) [Rhodovastum atsumiense]|nr:protein of unknown function [Rhodovastum atsumiense]